jgi:hypothetical protein
VEGGSANDYDYVSGDPINNLDLDGSFCVAGKNPNGSCRGSRAVKFAKCAAGELNPFSFSVGSSVAAGGAVGEAGRRVLLQNAKFVSEAARLGVVVSGSTAGTGTAVALIVVGGAVVGYGIYKIAEACRNA